MSWRAAKAVEKSAEKTKELLFKPFNPRFWLKLAVVVFLLGSANINSNTSNITNRGDITLEEITPYLYLILAAIVIIIVLALVFSLVSAVFEFVFLESVLKKEVQIVLGFKKHLNRGARLFVFRIALGLTGMALILALTLPVILAFTSGKLSNILLLIVCLIVGLPLFLIIVAVLALVGMSTKDFVVPLMLNYEEGILASWKRLINLIKNDKWQFAVYAVLRIALAIVAAVISFVIALILLLIVAVILGIPTLTMALVLAKLGFTISSVGMPLLLVAAIALLIVVSWALAYTTVLITLPIPVFFRFFSLLFLEETDKEVFLIRKGKREETKRELKPSKFYV